MTKEPIVCRWGVLGTGAISEKFVRDLLIDPKTRDVSDIVHRVVAVGSRSITTARDFIHRIEGLTENTTKAHATYHELVVDPDVDVIYVGTPHPVHFSSVMLCLENNKNVLCEKPITITAKQARKLCAVAKQKKCFLMEAVWTRFFPLTYSLQKIIASGTIGEIYRVDSDFSIRFSPDSLPPNHRLVNPELGGGGLLDLGPYSWMMLALTLLHQILKPASTSFRDSADGSPVIDSLALPEIRASGILYKHPNTSLPSHPIDSSVVAILEFPTPSGGKAQGVLISSMLQNTNSERGVTIYGNKGRIRIPHPVCSPVQFGVTIDATATNEEVPPSNGQNHKPGQEEIHKFDIPGNAKGYIWEADEVARCIASGRLESKRMPHSETILMMEVFDEIRRQIGVKYPSPVEAVP